MSGQLDTIPGQRGYLVMSSDGALLQSAGDLTNDESTATVVLHMVQNCGKLLKQLGSGQKDTFHRLAVVFKDYTLVASVGNQKIYVVKRINKET